jgi:hypothetical protein
MTDDLTRQSQEFVLHQLDCANNNVNDMYRSILTMQSRFDGMEARFAALEARFGSMEARFGSMESRFEACQHASPPWKRASSASRHRWRKTWTGSCAPLPPAVGRQQFKCRQATLRS